jgi:lipid A 3-O-deacylase
MTWTATVWRPSWREGDGVYIGGFLGGAVPDGNLRVQEDDNKALGTRALYHLGAEVGYQIDRTYSVESYFSHLSNAGASSHNPGLNNIGVRVGFHF